MQSTDELRSTYNRIAHDYHQDHLTDTWDDDYFSYFAEAIAPRGRVLDLGCRPGTETKRLIANGFEVEGFDLSDELLVIAREQNPHAKFIQGDMRSLPYADESFDGVFAKASLLHIPKQDMDTVLQEIHRVMKPKAIVHVAVKKARGDAYEAEQTENDYGYDYKRFFPTGICR